MQRTDQPIPIIYQRKFITLLQVRYPGCSILISVSVSYRTWTDTTFQTKWHRFV